MVRNVGQQGFHMASGVQIAMQARSLRAVPAGIEPVGRGDGENGDIAPVAADGSGGGDGFAGQHALIGDHHLAFGRRGLQPIGAPDDRVGQGLIDLARRLLDAAGGEAQIDRAAGAVARPVGQVRPGIARALHIVESPIHDDGQFVGEGRLEAGQSILRHADQRGSDGLVRAALAGEGNA